MCFDRTREGFLYSLQFACLLGCFYFFKIVTEGWNFDNTVQDNTLKLYWLFSKFQFLPRSKSIFFTISMSFFFQNSETWIFYNILWTGHIKTCFELFQNLKKKICSWWKERLKFVWPNGKRRLMKVSVLFFSFWVIVLKKVVRGGIFFKIF